MEGEDGKRHKELDSRLVRRAFGKLGAGVDGDEDVVGGRGSVVSMAGASRKRREKNGARQAAAVWTSSGCRPQPTCGV